MTLYSSRTPRDLNHDPEPWRNPNDGERRAHGVKWISGPDIHDPRPEFDHAQHNAPNPILVDFREVYGIDPERFDYARRWVLDFADGDEWAGYPPEQVDHARSVLSRLAVLA